MEDTESTLHTICSSDAVDDADNVLNQWLVQVLWSNEALWKSAKITTMKRDEGELSVVYLENEMEDTLDLNGNVTFRFVANRRGAGNVLVCCFCR